MAGRAPDIPLKCETSAASLRAALAKQPAVMRVRARRDRFCATVVSARSQGNKKNLVNNINWLMAGRHYCAGTRYRWNAFSIAIFHPVDHNVPPRAQQVWGDHKLMAERGYSTYGADDGV